MGCLANHDRKKLPSVDTMNENENLAALCAVQTASTSNKRQCMPMNFKSFVTNSHGIYAVHFIQNRNNTKKAIESSCKVFLPRPRRWNINNWPTFRPPILALF